MIPTLRINPVVRRMKNPGMLALAKEQHAGGMGAVKTPGDGATRAGCWAPAIIQGISQVSRVPVILIDRRPLQP
jgi:hypothetical protein